MSLSFNAKDIKGLKISSLYFTNHTSTNLSDNHILFPLDCFKVNYDHFVKKTQVCDMFERGILDMLGTLDMFVAWDK